MRAASQVVIGAAAMMGFLVVWHGTRRIVRHLRRILRGGR